MMNRKFARQYTYTFSRELALANTHFKNRRSQKARLNWYEAMGTTMGMVAAAKAFGVTDEELQELTDEIKRVRMEYDFAINDCNGDPEEIGATTSDYYDMYPDYIF